MVVEDMKCISMGLHHKTLERILLENELRKSVQKVIFTLNINRK